MKILIINAITAVNLLLMPIISFGQAPNLGIASSFVLFTSVGAFNNTEALSVVTGDVGTNVGAFNAFPPGTLIGQIHVQDGISAQVAPAVASAYSYVDALTCGLVHGVTFGGGEVLGPNIYCAGAASTLNGDLTLDGQGDPGAIFIFQIDGAFATTTLSNVFVINGASLCNVYWQVNGQFDLGAGSVFRGTVLASGAINLLAGSTLFGRGLSQAGAINTAALVATIPSVGIPVFALGATSSRCQGAETITYTATADNTTGITYSLDAGSLAGGNSIVSTTGAVTYTAGWTGTTIITATAEGCSNGPTTATHTVTVNPDATITLTSSPGTNVQSPCINIAITNITYAIGGGGTGAGVTGLPPGITGIYNAGVFTINGSPSVTGTFNYTVTTTGTCVQITATGTITVTSNATITLTSAAGTNSQSLCINTPLTNITYTVGGGTGAGATGLPAGVTGVYSAGVFTISGTPTVLGVFTYTITTTGTCAQAIVTGTITVNDCDCVTINRWTNTSGDFKWTTASNWSLGHAPDNLSEVVIKTGTTLTITDVPDNIHIDKLNILNNGNLGTHVTLIGSVDASVIILDGLLSCLETAFVVGGTSELHNNVPGSRVNIILMPGANGSLEGNGVFDQAVYYNCVSVTTGNLDQWIDTAYGGNILNYYKTKGLLLKATPTQHAEFIQEANNNEKVLAWVEWYLPSQSPTFAYNNVHYTSIPIYTDLAEIPCCLTNGDVLHELNILNNYGADIKPEGYFVRKWDGALQTWSQRNDAPFVTGGWYGTFTNSCDPELNILHSGGKINDPYLGHVEAGEGLEIFPKPSWPDHPLMVWYGPLNNFPTSAPLTWNVSLPSSPDNFGWILAGNPFASAIKLGELAGGTSPGPGWIWPSTFEPGIYYWDASRQRYRYWNYSTHDTLGFSPDKTATANYIARSQGFFVYATAPPPGGADLFQIDNRARQFQTQLEIAKSIFADVLTNTMHLYVTKTDENFEMDEMAVHFIDNATTDYMSGIDAYKMFRGGNTFSELYTVTDDNAAVVIKNYQSVTGTTTVPIHFQVGPSGNYDFRANDLNSFSSRTNVLLVDKKLNKTQDLKANPVYSFSSVTSDDPYRFDILFSNVLNGMNDLSGDGLKVYSSGNSIFIICDKIQDVNGTVTVYDMIGRQLIRENLQGDLITRLNTNLENGYYVVSVKTDKANVNRKVYLTD